MGVVIGVGFWFRVYGLEARPMHTDEAVHAAKFGALLDEGFYAYDPDEYHGPTLNYLTLLVAKLRGQSHYTQIDETTLRLVPALIGTLLLLTPLLFFDGIGLRAAVFSTVLLALSPAFVYFSRYYIQEMLLVLFTAGFLGGLWRYLRTEGRGWILMAGVCAGLMHATKETCAFTFAAVLLALLLSLVVAGSPARLTLYNRNGLLGLLAAIVTSVLFFSSFGKNLDGILDSVLTYTYWFGRAGQHSIHAHPWYWYLDLLVWIEFVQPIVWNEDVIVAGALFGFFFAFRRHETLSHRRFFCVFLAFFTLILTVIYSAIPYKTPWCALNFLYGMVLLAGLAGDRILKWDMGAWSKRVMISVFILFGIASPLVQSVLLNGRYAAHPGNPWAYAHTGPDVFEIDRVVRQAAAAHPDGKNMYIQVVAPGHDYWPLPWYLRDFSQVAYTAAVDGRQPNPDLVLCHVESKPQILRKLYDYPPPGQRQLYVPLFDDPIELRPSVEWRGVLTRNLWEKAFGQAEPVPDPAALKSDEVHAVQIEPSRREIKNLVKFSHQAMNTVFEMWIQHDDGSYAGRAARTAFHEADRLEQELSRFIDNSDIGRINAAAAGDVIVVSPDTMACLIAAEEAYDLTDGAFDVTVGPLVRLWKTGQPTPEATAALLQTQKGRAYSLTPDAMSVTVLRDNVGLDLSGVAKGYALDRMADILREWGIDRALVHGGTSTVLAMGAPVERDGWPVVLSNPYNPAERLARLELAHQTLSCSGLDRGSHIINPTTGHPVVDRRAVWLLTTAPGAMADALTTALMVMPIEAVETFSQTRPEASLLLVFADAAAPLLRLGDWPTP